MRLLMTTLCLALVSGAALAQAETASTSSLGVTRDIVTAEQKQQIRGLVEAGATRKDAREQVLSAEQRSELAKVPKSGSAKKGKHIMAQLDLTAEQKEKIDKIRAEGGSRKDVRGVFTDEQAAKYDALRSARKANRDKNTGKKDKKVKEGTKGKSDSESTAGDE